ncbi:hypothetical protein CEXT_359531 [Caerostris extrusa]|uniref:Uncharacterized protein n=1 Tax=Caerostris extrusa TaxID=172846 RepID=A0AAV4XET7_CAEEX|nr:hypothetical protein CEXT_359531 [Caerostris extrusa]
MEELLTECESDQRHENDPNKSSSQDSPLHRRVGTSLLAQDIQVLLLYKASLTAVEFGRSSKMIESDGDSNELTLNVQWEFLYFLL